MLVLRGLAGGAGLASLQIRVAVIAVLTLLTPGALLAGPPFVTDDPEPVEFQHFEVYLACVTSRDFDGWSGTAPQLEVNCGAYPDLQIHLIIPTAFSAPGSGPLHYGLGDVELGAKFRFVHEGDRMPQIGVFPLVELPSGSEAKGLGEGHAQILIPLWLQKAWGVWTSYGGVGYWLDTGAGSRDSWFLGWQLHGTSPRTPWWAPSCSIRRRNGRERVLRRGRTSEPSLT